MKLSIYTFIKDGLYLDYHVISMLMHHLPLADEIVVNEGYSTDGTYEAISGLDPKIKVYRNNLGQDHHMPWTTNAKNWARAQCSGDWCILLDCDEFIPEWEFLRLRRALETTEHDILPLRFRHFYANYLVEQLPNESKLPPIYGSRIHRNLESISPWGDGANVKIADREYEAPDVALAFECHHFGEVRYAARLRQKWRVQARRHTASSKRSWLPNFVFDFFPHRWDDPEILPRLRLYQGRYIRAVHDDPNEFVRDGFKIAKLLGKSVSESGEIRPITRGS